MTPRSGASRATSTSTRAPTARPAWSTTAAWCRSRRTTTWVSPAIPRSLPRPTTRSIGGVPASGSARLIVGSRPVHSHLESALADWKRAERAVLFTTGYAANLGVVTTFAGPDVLVCSDELNHASIIDGRRLAASPLAIYRHRDAAHVDQILGASNHPARAGRLGDGVLDGRRRRAGARAQRGVRTSWRAPRARRSARRAPARGRPPRRRRRRAGRHVVEDPRRARRFRRRSCALHRSRREPRPFLHLHDRVDAGRHGRGARRARRSCDRREGDELRTRLRDNIDRLRPNHPSPIIPYVCGSEQHAIAVAAALLDDGLLVTAIRPPTVAPGTSRLRVTLSAAHTAEQVERLARALAAHFPA